MNSFFNVQEFLSEKTVLMESPEIKELLKWVTQGDIISFGGGLPDPQTFPTKEISEIASRGLRDKGNILLQYSSSEGQIELREQIIDFMEWRGVKIPSVDNILIVNGSQQSLDLFGKILLNKGDIILMELPSYFAAINAFKFYEPDFIGIGMDNNGMDMEVLEKVLKDLKRKGKKPKLLYTVPTGQNPTGISLSFERRKTLLELASRYDFLIIEDDPYSFFIYEPMDIKHLKSMDKEGRVIYTSTFSKILSPGLRLGWIAANETISEKLVLAKQHIDVCTSALIQYIAYEALKGGIVRRNLPNTRELYKQKRDRMLNAIEENFPDVCSWTEPVGGLFIFAWVPEKIDTGEMIKECVQKEKVAYLPGKPFYVDGKGTNTMRLNFTYPSMEMIDEGIQRIGRVIKHKIMS